MSPRTSLRLFLPWAGLFAVIVAALVAMCSARRQAVDDAGRIFFVDADCYARMTRVREVCAQPGTVLRHHDFENYPAGITPHTTVPLDYLTAGLNGVYTILRCKSPRDLAGAWISPLLGIIAIVALWCWARGVGAPGAWGMLIVFAVSPIVAHGFAYARPDHQSLEMACMALALTGEWFQWRKPSRVWNVVAGIGWGVGLWTSLYEPLILAVLVAVAGLIFNREALFCRERLPGLAVGGLILVAAALIEGWRVEIPGFGDDAGAGYFAVWSRQISELQSIPPWSLTLYRWTGWGILAAPIVLLLARGEARPLARAQLLLLIAVFAMTCWQVRWGYFLPLVYVLTLPVQFAILPAKWRPWAMAVLLLGGAPMAGEWRERWLPSPEIAAQLAEQREDLSQLRDVAGFLKRESAIDGEDLSFRGVLAPWWLSPPLVYWSRQRAVAGSSHESLPGIVDVARFYLAVDPAEAAELLRARQVRWVVAYEPARIAATAAPLLNRPNVPKRSMCAVLYDHPDYAPRFLRLALVNPYFKVYEVRPSLLTPSP